MRLTTSPDHAPEPLAVGTTILPRRSLSYRWTITDAKIFLEKVSELKSPTFSVTLPQRKESGLNHQTSLWHLLAWRSAGSLYLSLYLSKNQNAATAPFSKVLISEGAMSVINSKMKAVVTKTASKSECVVNGSKTECLRCNVMPSTDIDKYLS